MPDYDYDEYTRRHEEYELNKENEGNDAEETVTKNEEIEVETEVETPISLDKIEDDLAW
jgi:hypothetical protein